LKMPNDEFCNCHPGHRYVHVFDRDCKIDAGWLKSPDPAARMPGFSVIVRDETDPGKSRRIPCSSREMADAVQLAVHMFARDGVRVHGAFDPPAEETT
jgi:hypothetical protein